MPRKQLEIMDESPVKNYVFKALKADRIQEGQLKDFVQKLRLSKGKKCHVAASDWPTVSDLEVSA